MREAFGRQRTKPLGNKVAIKLRLLGRRVQEFESSRKVPLTFDLCYFPSGLGRVKCDLPGHAALSGGLPLPARGSGSQSEGLDDMAAV